MSARQRKVPTRIAAAAVPFGMAVAAALHAPAASAATVAAGAGPTRVTIARPLAAARPAAARHSEARRLRAYAWAATQAGHPYVWGGTGPGYDCSGLVMMAYRHAGIHLPRTTFEMLASPLLIRVWHPRMGDLAFYGSGHVELFRKWGYTFGAHDFGSRVGLIRYGWGWRPTAFYRVR
jgi:cell wall-associated NlpC family hydrolase